MVVTYTHAKEQGQRSVGLKYRVETNGQTVGQTDGDDCITSHANAVGNNILEWFNMLYCTERVRQMGAVGQTT